MLSENFFSLANILVLIEGIAKIIPRSIRKVLPDTPCVAN